MDSPKNSWTISDLDLLEARIHRQAFDSFYAFRQLMRQDLIWKGWFHRHLAKQLQAFFDDLQDGKRPLLVLTVPPQHGKSLAVTDFISWVIGRNPALDVIYSSYGDVLGKTANRRIQQLLNNEHYKKIFPTRIGDKKTSDEIIFEQGGSFINSTVRGPITGRPMALGVIDDPHKNREEANSIAVRDRVWAWYTDDFKTRAAEHSGTVVIMTRWHLDDLVGRLLESSEASRVRLVSFPAIAEEKEEFRQIGDPLFPELKSLEFLEEQRASLTESGWSALYQQGPIPIQGGMFPIERFEILTAPPAGTIAKSVRYWDKAGTKDGSGAQTAGVLVHKISTGQYYISDVVTGRWSALEREQRIKHTAQLDGPGVEIWTEQEPGSGGKESAERTIAMLAGYRVYADRVHGDKVTRAEPYAAQVQGGNVSLIRASWNRGLLEQHEHFPSGKLKDIVDAAGGAFSKLTAVTKTAGVW